MIKLSDRLHAAADFVTSKSRVADIGTDHGYLPIYLVESGRCPGALAMDIKEGPIARAREHIAENQLESYIEARLSDGLKNLRHGEADSIVIAGMGGLTMIRILEAGAELAADAKELVLGPQSDFAKVRQFLREQKMYIDKENLVYEDGKYYPMLHVVWKEPKEDVQAGYIKIQAFLQDKLQDPRCVQQALDQYGAYLACSRHPVLSMLLERDGRLKQEILCSLQQSKGQQEHQLRKQELEEQLKGIQALQAFMES